MEAFRTVAWVMIMVMTAIVFGLAVALVVGDRLADKAADFGSAVIETLEADGGE